MRYIDSGSRDPNQTLGAWLQAMLTSSVVGLRMQSGFFSAEALGFLAPTLVRLAASNQLVNVLIGSNESATLRSDVFQLGHLIGLPRSNVRFGVVQYVNGFFHPKVYHFLRADGSQFPTSDPRITRRRA